MVIKLKSVMRSLLQRKIFEVLLQNTLTGALVLDDDLRSRQADLQQSHWDIAVDKKQQNILYIGNKH